MRCEERYYSYIVYGPYEVPLSVIVSLFFEHQIFSMLTVRCLELNPFPVLIVQLSPQPLNHVRKLTYDLLLFSTYTPIRS
jgi:hypothetical protein